MEVEFIADLSYQILLSTIKKDPHANHGWKDLSHLPPLKNTVCNFLKAHLHKDNRALLYCHLHTTKPKDKIDKINTF